MQIAKKEIKWTPEQGFTCPYCGASNPAPSDNCVNCDKNIHQPSLLTLEEYRTYKTIRSTHARRHAI